MFGISFTFYDRFFGTPWMLLEFRQLHIIGKILQELYQFRPIVSSKDKPAIIGNGDHHPRIDRSEFMRKVVTGELLIDFVGSVYTA